ncbi:MAG: FAD-dependent oxidoreductase, partial [Chloroflexota bacterium]
MQNVDVAILGAGPAGSAAAVGLARLGYQVALIDKKFFPREKLCGDF